MLGSIERMVFLRQVMSFFARMFVTAAIRIAVAAVCCMGIWFSWKAERADSLFREDTPESLRAAIKLVPDGWQYYMRLAQLDRDTATQREPRASPRSCSIHSCADMTTAWRGKTLSTSTR